MALRGDHKIFAILLVLGEFHDEVSNMEQGAFIMEVSIAHHTGLLNRPAGIIAVLTAMMLVVLPLSAQSHHSFAMYDQTVDVTVTGKLIRFIPGGNHAQLIFQLLDENGEGRVTESGDPDIWGVETAPSATIGRRAPGRTSGLRRACGTGSSSRPSSSPGESSDDAGPLALSPTRRVSSVGRALDL